MTNEDETPKPRGRRPSLTGYPVCEIQWVDSSETVPNEELTEADLPVPHVKYSAGYLLHDSKEFVVLAGICNDHGTYDYAIAIPRCSIVDERRRTR